jgi:hypothetical protein
MDAVAKDANPGPRFNAYGCGWVIESNDWNGQPQFWRNGHGWMGTLRQATIFVKKNDAISKCVTLGSKGCTVLEANFSVGRAVYPPSRAKLSNSDNSDNFG